MINYLSNCNYVILAFIAGMFTWLVTILGSAVVFLFKKVHNGKIAGYKISKCQRTELWHNNLNQLYISNYFGEVKKTALLLNNEAYKDIDSTIINPILTYINYKDETLSFIELWNSTYENEILTMDVNNPYIIK